MIKHTFMDLKTVSILDMVKVTNDVTDDDKVYVITRINVPTHHRGKGIGSDLLKQACSQADHFGLTLKLEVNPSGTLNRRQLIDWYRRYGFMGNGYTQPMTRLPSKK